MSMTPMPTTPATTNPAITSTATSQASSLVDDSITPKRWTVRDYHRLSELGLLHPNERTELIEGQILLMAAKGTPHVLALRLCQNRLEAQLTEQAATEQIGTEQVGDEQLESEQPVFVSTQDPIGLDDMSEPEPDLAIIRGSILDYAERHPSPRDVCLVVEIADSTLKYDTETKDKLYAQSGIVDYWVIDLKNRQLHIFREPTATGYGSHLILQEPATISPLAFAGISIELSDVLPPLPQT